MARHVTVSLFDDLDGARADETVLFGLDGSAFEIDLSEDHARALRSTLEPYVRGARRQAASGRVYHRTDLAPDPATVRAWAKSRGVEVPARGRIPRRVYDAFAEAS